MHHATLHYNLNNIQKKGAKRSINNWEEGNETKTLETISSERATCVLQCLQLQMLPSRVITKSLPIFLSLTHTAIKQSLSLSLSFFPSIATENRSPCQTKRVKKETKLNKPIKQNGTKFMKISRKYKINRMGYHNADLYLMQKKFYQG